MSSNEGSRSLGSQVPLYLWGGSQVHKKRFEANLHRITTEAQFQKWRASFASAIPNDVHVRLVEPSTDDVARKDPNDPDARIITFRPFYFSLGFKFPMSKFFRKVLHAMGCAPSQCTPNVYRIVICFDNLNRFFKLGLTLREFFYFFEVRRCNKYAQLCIHKEKMFDILSDDDHAWSTDVLEVSGRWEGVADNGPQVPITYCDGDDIRKKIDLEPDMAKIHQAMNIPVKFREWRWLLSEYRRKDGGLPPARDIERWKRYGPNSDDQPDEQDESSTKLSGKRKVAPKLSRDEVATSRARHVSPLKKKHHFPSDVIKPSSKEVSYTEKTQVSPVPSSSAKVKYTVGADSKKVHDMRDITDTMLKSSVEKFKIGDLPCKDVCAKPSSSAEKQKAADFSRRSLSRLHQSNDEDRTEKVATSLGKHEPLAELQETKGRADAALLTPLEARIAVVHVEKEFPARSNDSDDLPQRTKSCPTRDVCMSGLLKTNFLASSSACAGLVDHLWQAGDLGTFPSLSLEEQKNESIALLQKETIFDVETIRNSSITASFSDEFEKLEKKNAALSDLLSTEQTRQNMKILDLKRQVSLLKSFIALKDGNLDSLAAALNERKEACLHIEHEYAYLSQSYDKLLSKFETFQENTKELEPSSR